MNNYNKYVLTYSFAMLKYNFGYISLIEYFTALISQAFC